MTETVTVLYTARATAAGDGRKGAVTSSDGLLDLGLALPIEMGGPGGRTNPEQLFAAGYAACFHSALKVVAKGAGADATGSTVAAAVGIGKQGAGYGLVVELVVDLPSVPTPRARELVDTAHQVCPYSNATRGNVEVTLTLAGCEA